VAGDIGNHEGGAVGPGDGLEGDTTASEDREFAEANFHGVALVGLVDFLDADGSGVASVDGGRLQSKKTR